MNIILKKLSLSNFKGVHSFSADFGETTNIYGDNATGKTTLFDAFLWLFFGKNSEDASKFEVKRLDANNKFIEGIEAEVCAELIIGDELVTVKKVLRQKWVKKRGEIKPEYAGDENVYYWNDVPQKESEFKKEVSLVIDEVIFKLITNPFYFNGIRWEERRNILETISGKMSDEAILDRITTPEYKIQVTELATALRQKKTIEQFKKQIAEKKKRIKEELAPIPSRIDEVERGKPDVQDFISIRTNIADLEGRRASIQNAMKDEAGKQAEENKRRADVLKEFQKKDQDHRSLIFNIKTQIQNIEFSVREEINRASRELESRINVAKHSLKTMGATLEAAGNTAKMCETSIIANEQRLQTLRDKYTEIDGEVFQMDPEACKCPTCQQDLQEGDAEAKRQELLNNFNTNKTARLNKLIGDAEELKSQIAETKQRKSAAETQEADLATEISNLEAKIKTLTPELQEAGCGLGSPEENKLQNKLDTHNEYQDLKRQLKELEAQELQAPAFEPMPTNEGLELELKEISGKIQDANMLLLAEQKIQQSNARIVELREEETRLNQELADQESIEYVIMQFTKTRVEAIESRINSMFSTVRFKMFKDQVNGGEAECCDTLVNSNGSFVPFSDANNAARINAGLDIINTLSRHYNITAPVFIDNRESVTTLIPTSSQVINLIVSSAHKILTVA